MSRAIVYPHKVMAASDYPTTKEREEALAIIHALRPYFEEAYPGKPIVSSGLAGIAAKAVLDALEGRRT